MSIITTRIGLAIIRVGVAMSGGLIAKFIFAKCVFEADSRNISALRYVTVCQSKVGH